MSETAKQLDVPDGALCLGCNYSLRGLPGNRCPECGREFDRGDPWTMNTGRPIGRIAKFFLSPIGQPTTIAATIATTLTFWWTTYLSGAWFAMVAATLLWITVYAYRFIRSLIRRFLARIYRQPIHKHRHYQMAILLLMTGLLIWTRAPLRVLLLFHRPALQKAAHHYYADVPMLKPPPAPGWIGLYRCSSVSIGIGVTLEMGAAEFEYNPYKGWAPRANERTIRWGDYYVTDDGVESEFFAFLICGPRLNG